MSKLELSKNQAGFEAVNYFISKNCRAIKLIQLSVLFVFISSTVHAAPVISTVVKTENSLTISGANFGSDQGATTPVFWDNFDSGSNGADLVTPLSGSINWTLNIAPKPKYNNQQKHSGYQSAYALHSNGIHWSFFTVGSRTAPIPISLFYYQTFWFRYNTPRPLGTAGETKLIRMFGDYGTGIPDKPYVKTGGVNSWWTTSYKTETSTTEPLKTLPVEPAENVWHRVEALYKQSSVGGASDGAIKIVIDGKTQADFTNIITRESSDIRWIMADFFSGMTNWDTKIAGLSWEKWIDDAYLSKTWQRVEVCDTPTWAARTHCEMQLATEWTEGQIKVNYNPGSFTSDQSVYVYVSDSGGVVNSDGFKFSIGAPSAPKNVIKIPNK